MTFAPPVGGRIVSDLQITKAWLVDPFADREGPGELVVSDGILEAVTWLEGHEAAGVDDGGVIVAPGFIDLHAHFRQPGNEAAETVASGAAAAAHGGFTTVCLMANTDPPIDSAGALARERAVFDEAGSPIRLLPYGAATVGRAGEQLAELGPLADGGAIGFSDDGAPIRSPAILRNALLYAAMHGLAVIDHPEDLSLTNEAEANEGLVATVLGLKGWPRAAETAAVARDLAVFADALRDDARARLHLTHLSNAASLDLVRRAKADALPVTCDVTPHHVALTDEWLAGARRWAWEALTEDGWARDPWSDGALVGAPYDTSLRVNPPLRSPGDAAACLAAIRDGTADAIATDHAPHNVVDKEVEFGQAAPGISGIETALGLLLVAVEAGRLPLRRLIEALTSGPARVLGSLLGRDPGDLGFVEGRRADLVVFDRSETWRVEPGALLSRGKNSPLLGMELAGSVILTIADGRVAFEA